MSKIEPILSELKGSAVDPAHQEILDLLQASAEVLAGTPAGEKMAEYRAKFETPSNADVTPTWQGVQGLSQEVMDAGNVDQCKALQDIAKKIRARAGKYA